MFPAMSFDRDLLMVLHDVARLMRTRFDRWARTDGEAIRMRDYIRQNPVRAGLVSHWEDYPWTQSEPDAP